MRFFFNIFYPLWNVCMPRDYFYNWHKSIYFSIQAMTEPPFDDYIDEISLQMLILRREAAFLYDAVKLYAAALKEMLLNGEDPMNGKALIQKLFNTHYKSVLGYTVYLNENGDAQGNYTLVALDRKNNLTGT